MGVGSCCGLLGEPLPSPCAPPPPFFPPFPLVICLEAWAGNVSWVPPAASCSRLFRCAEERKPWPHGSTAAVSRWSPPELVNVPCHGQAPFLPAAAVTRTCPLVVASGFAVPRWDSCRVCCCCAVLRTCCCPACAAVRARKRVSTCLGSGARCRMAGCQLDVGGHPPLPRYEGREGKS